MKLLIEIEMDNYAFVGNNAPLETISYLHKVIRGLGNIETSGLIFQTNGNKVGWWDIEIEEDGVIGDVKEEKLDKEFFNRITNNLLGEKNA